MRDLFSAALISPRLPHVPHRIEKRRSLASVFFSRHFCACVNKDGLGKAVTPAYWDFSRFIPWGFITLCFKGRPRSNIALQPALSAATGSSTGIYQSEYSTHVGSLMAKSAKNMLSTASLKILRKTCLVQLLTIGNCGFYDFWRKRDFWIFFPFFTFNWNYEKIWVIRRHTTEIHCHTKYISLVLIEKYLLTTVLKLYNGGSWNACTIKRSITILCIPKQIMWQNSVVP